MYFLFDPDSTVELVGKNRATGQLEKRAYAWSIMDINWFTDSRGRSLTGEARMIMYTLMFLYTGCEFHSFVRFLAADYGISQATVKKYMKELWQAGLIEVIRSGNQEGVRPKFPDVIRLLRLKQKGKAIPVTQMPHTDPFAPMPEAMQPLLEKTDKILQAKAMSYMMGFC